MLPLATLELGVHTDAELELGAQVDVEDIMALEGVHQVLVHSALATEAAAAMRIAVVKDMLDRCVMRSEVLVGGLARSARRQNIKMLLGCGRVVLLCRRVVECCDVSKDLPKEMDASLICKVPGRRMMMCEREAGVDPAISTSMF